MIDLDKLEALGMAASPGPWYVQWVYAENGAFSHFTLTAADGTEVIGDDLGPGRADTHFIAAANPAAVQEMIDLIRKQEAALTGAQARIGGLLLAQAGLVAQFEAALKAAQTGHGSYGPNYDGNKLAESVKAIVGALKVPA